MSCLSVFVPPSFRLGSFPCRVLPCCWVFCSSPLYMSLSVFYLLYGITNLSLSLYLLVPLLITCLHNSVFFFFSDSSPSTLLPSPSSVSIYLSVSVDPYLFPINLNLYISTPTIMPSEYLVSPLPHDLNRSKYPSFLPARSIHVHAPSWIPSYLLLMCP